MITDIPDLGLMGEEIESPNGMHRLFYGDGIDVSAPRDNKVVLFIGGKRSGVIETGRSVTRAAIFDNGYSLLEVYDRESRQAGLVVLQPSGAIVHDVAAADFESVVISDSGNILRRPL